MTMTAYPARLPSPEWRGGGRGEEPASFPDEIESFSGGGGGGAVGGGRADLSTGERKEERARSTSSSHVCTFALGVRGLRLSLLSGDGGAGGSICWGVAAARSTAARASRLQRRECEGGDGM